MPTKSSSKYHFSDIIPFLYNFLTFSLFSFGIGYLFWTQRTEIKLNTAAAIVLSCLLISAIFIPLKLFIRCLHGKNKIEKLNYCRISLLIGLGGCVLCTITSRIVVYFIADNIYIVGYCLFTTLATYTIFSCTFVLSTRKKCKLVCDSEDKLYQTLIALNFVAWVVTVGVALTYGKNRNPILNFQWFFGIPCATSMLQFYQVLRGRIELKKEKCLMSRPRRNENIRKYSENTQRFEHSRHSEISTNVSYAVPFTVNVERYGPNSVTSSSPPEPTTANLEQSSSTLECKICMLEYSETAKQIPRILKECGHTICEICAENLLKKNNGQHLFCPFCQTVTVVKGPASLLPKNYGMLDIIEERRKI